MNTNTLIPKLTKSFQRCTKVLDATDIYRCEQIYKDIPRSVYFFKAGSDLPDSEELSRIQQDIVGPSYFLAKDASRWNHYFVFVSDDENRNNSKFRDKQRSIEANKDYARKLIIFDSEIDEFIDHSITPVDADAPARNIVADWTQKLAIAGLGEIQTNSSRAPLIRKIRAGKTQPVATPERPCDDQRRESPSVHLIDRFTLSRFGFRAIAGKFEFGRINLIHGPNGSGKTSLLEAVEHFFCGATCRSGGQTELLDAEIAFAGISQPVKFQQHNNSCYQDRDQRWYGRTINRGNRLWEGFSRFNFLNTDAAVHFSTDNNQQNLTDALSKIALGPEAAFTWNRIGEFEADLDRDLGPIRSRLSGLKQAIADAMKREAALKSASPQIEASINIALQILSELGWKLPAEIVTPPDAQWFIQFQPLRDFMSATQVSDSIRSIGDLSREISTHEKNLLELKVLRGTAKSENGKQANLRANRDSIKTKVSLLQRLEQFLVVGLTRWVEEEDRIRKEISNIAMTLIPLPELDMLEEVAKGADFYSETIDEFEVIAKEKLSRLKNDVRALEREQVSISNQLTLVDTIISQIHNLGHQYAEQAPHAQECPLCRTRMGMAELIHRVEDVGDQKAQSKQFETVSKNLSAMQTQIGRWESAILTIDQIRLQSDRPMRLSLSEEIRKFRKHHEKKQTLNTALEQAQTQRKSKEGAGFSIIELSNLREQFDASPEWENYSSANLEQVRVLCERLNKKLLSIQQEESQLRTAMVETAKNLQVLIDANEVSNENALSEKLQASMQALVVMQAAFNTLPDPVRQQFAEDLQELTGLCGRSIKALDDLSTQVQAELGRNKELGVLKVQLDRERERLSVVTEERDRMQLALNVLRDIKENHSLEAGVSSFLSSNLTSIQKIFSKIHVPHELQLSSLEGVQLERIGSQEKDLVKLNQISTGQRAALMLSVFLTLNLSLRNGPPQVLIDDPIAHIDDLNSLSFLDYLADIAQSGTRQIFFATADDKLANLFQKKMEFLGDDFRAIELSPKYS